MNDLLNKLNTIKKELSGKDAVKPVTVFWNKGVKDNTIRKVQEKLDFEIPHDILKIYKVFDGLVLDWEIRLPDEPWRTVMGRSNIPRLEFLFKNEQIIAYKEKKSQLDHYWPDNSDQEKTNRYKEFFVVDFLKTGESILLKPSKQNGGSKLFCYTFPDEYSELKVTFEEYIKTLLETKGMYGWQSLLNNAAELNANCPRDYNLPETYNKIFPGINRLSVQPIHVPGHNSAIFSNTNQSNNYFHLWSERVDSLKKNNKFKKIVFTPNPGVKISTLRRIKKNTGFDLPEQMRAFYYFLNGFKLKWMWQDGDISIEGNIDLLPLENVFGGIGGELTKSWNSDVNDGVLWNSKDLLKDPEKYPILKPLKRIESIEGASREVMIKIETGQDASNPKLYLLEKGDPVNFNINFFNYIKLLSENLGMEGWHKAFIEKNSKWVKNLSSVFPDADLTPYSNSYDPN